MFAKQSFIDVLVVVIVPILIIGAYMFWLRPADGNLLSLMPAADAVSVNDPGEKTKQAVEALSIKLDDGLFKDPAYLGLKEYTFELPTVPLSRQYPFVPPQAIIDLLRESQATPVQSKSKPGGIPTLSIKLETLKKASK